MPYKYHTCVCGKRIRGDHLSAHQQKCIKFTELEHRNVELEHSIAYLERCNNLELERRNTELERRVNELERRNNELTNSLMAAPRIQNNILYNVVNLCPFEATPLPNPDSVKRLLSSVYSLESAAESVPKYIKLKHFDNKNTCNIRMPNVRGKTIQVVESDQNGKKRWCSKSKKEMLDKLTDKNLEELIDEFGAEKITKWKDWYTQEGLNENGYDKTSEWKELVGRVERVLMDER